MVLWPWTLRIEPTASTLQVVLGNRYPTDNILKTYQVYQVRLNDFLDSGSCCTMSLLIARVLNWDPAMQVVSGLGRPQLEGIGQRPDGLHCFVCKTFESRPKAKQILNTICKFTMMYLYAIHVACLLDLSMKLSYRLPILLVTGNTKV